MFSSWATILDPRLKENGFRDYKNYCEAVDSLKNHLVAVVGKLTPIEQGCTETLKNAEPKGKNVPGVKKKGMYSIAEFNFT